MSFPSALDSTSYTKLRGNGAVAPTYSADQYLCLGANTTAFAARVNQATFADSFAQVTFDGTSIGAYTDIEIGMTVLISHTNDRRAAFFVGRARLAATSTILYINETSVAVADNDFVFVLADYRLFGKLGRESGSVYYKDYSLTFTPPGPLIYNLQSAYAGVVSGSPAGYTVSFAALALTVTSGATISSYAWTIPSGGTVTGGATNTANVTVRFDTRAAEYWVKLIVTDSGGRTSTRRFPVWAIPADLSTTVTLGFEGAQIERDLDGGQMASVTAFTGVDTLLDNTLACVLSVEHYNGSETFIVSNIDFVGRIRTGQHSTRADFTYSVLQEGAYTIEGIGAQLARISAPSIYMRSKASPAVWDEIKDLTLWRAMWYLLFHSTFHELHSLTFDETGTTYLYPSIQTQGGNLFDAINDLAQSITAGMEFASSGECKVARNANYQTTAERNALTTVANFTQEDWIDFNLSHEEVETIGAVGGDGGSYNTTSNKVLALLGNAPKVAQGNADGTSNLSRQILTANLVKAAAQTELAARLGHHYAFTNPVDTLFVTFPDGYHWLIPSYSQWYTFTIAASENTGGRAFTTEERWYCQNVHFSHDHALGGREVSATFRRESTGTPGKAYDPPASNEGTVYIPPIPPVPPFPPLNTPPDIYLPPNPSLEDVPPPIIINVPTNGSAVVVATANGIWTSTDFLASSSPQYNEVTPVLNGTIRAGALGFGREFYLLESDDTDSWVWYTPDIFATVPTWTSSAALSGVYTVIRTGSTQGEVYIKSLGSGWTHTFDFTVTNGSFIPRKEPGSVDSGLDSYFGVWNSGSGWGQAGVANYTHVCYIGRSVADTVFTYVKATASGAPGYVLAVNLYLDNVLADSLNGGNVAVVELTTEVTADLVMVFLQSSILAGTTLTEFIITLELHGLGENPFGGGGTSGAVTRYSTDYGATFAATAAVGGAVAGLDTQRIGTVVLAGADGQTKKAVSGGAYSAYGNPMPTNAQPNAIHIPRLQFGSASQNSGTLAQYLVGSGTLSSNQGLWKVINGTLNDITPTYGGNYYTSISPNTFHMSWWSGSRIAAIGNFGGTRRLKLTTNAGGAWSDASSALSGNATYIRYRKGDNVMRQLFIADTVPVYSPDHGGTLYPKAHPSPSGSLTDYLIFIEPLG